MHYISIILKSEDQTNHDKTLILFTFRKFIIYFTVYIFELSLK